jgi:L-ascorbate metabolism protein UlaG (beta-lactamase superfamily)
VTVDWEPIRNRRDLSVTFLKHASVLIKDIDRTYLVDPVFERIFWFIRDYTPLAFEVDRMPRPDHILITHGHYDHLDIPSLKRFDPGTHVISPIGYNEIFNGLGMHNRTQLDWFERHRENGREFTLLPANHWTMRSVLEGPNTALWGGYLIKTASGHTLYLSGDTAWFDGFDQIGSQWDIDLAIVNLGAYEPRWFMAPSHMNPAETVAALKQLRAKKLIITHWGTFRLGDEPVHFPPQDLEAALKAEGLQDRRIELGHGETFFA